MSPSDDKDEFVLTEREEQVFAAIAVRALQNMHADHVRTIEKQQFLNDTFARIILPGLTGVIGAAVATAIWLLTESSEVLKLLTPQLPLYALAVASLLGFYYVLSLLRKGWINSDHAIAQVSNAYEKHNEKYDAQMQSYIAFFKDQKELTVSTIPEVRSWKDTLNLEVYSEKVNSITASADWLLIKEPWPNHKLRTYKEQTVIEHILDDIIHELIYSGEQNNTKYNYLFYRRDKESETDKNLEKIALIINEYIENWLGKISKAHKNSDLKRLKKINLYQAVAERLNFKYPHSHKTGLIELPSLPLVKDIVLYQGFGEKERELLGDLATKRKLNNQIVVMSATPQKKNDVLSGSYSAGWDVYFWDDDSIEKVTSWWGSRWSQGKPAIKLNDKNKFVYCSISDYNSSR